MLRTKPWTAPLSIKSLQIFPYHLSDYVCRVLRITPFRYCCNLLYTVMRDERSYDRIPNFTVSPFSEGLPSSGGMHMGW